MQRQSKFCWRMEPIQMHIINCRRSLCFKQLLITVRFIWFCGVFFLQNWMSQINNQLSNWFLGVSISSEEGIIELLIQYGADVNVHYHFSKKSNDLFWISDVNVWWMNPSQLFVISVDVDSALWWHHWWSYYYNADPKPQHVRKSNFIFHWNYFRWIKQMQMG